MFKENNKHRQESLFGFRKMLSKAKFKKLTNSKAGYFYRLIFCNIDEKIFKPLYSDQKSRPNAPINTMVSALILKREKGITYRQLIEDIKFNIKTRYALGLQDLTGEPFSETTLFNFQRRVNDYFVKTGIDLIEQVFDDLTQQQLEQLDIKADIQRTDSFLISSNIRDYSRIELLVEVVKRFYRILSDVDKKAYVDLFTDYKDKSSGKFIYDLSSADVPGELKKLGQVYYQIINNFADEYGHTNIFKTVQRVFSEHFTEISDKVEVIPAQQLSSGILQSPDDPEATYRNKRGQNVKGYSGNVTETANPDNDLDLITDVGVEKNNVDDTKILNKRLDRIQEKTPDIKELHTDGGYRSEENTEKLESEDIEHITSAIRGPNAKVRMEIYREDGNYEVHCPRQKCLKVKKARKRYKAIFNNDECKNCPFLDDCPTHFRKRIKNRVYYFGEKDYENSKKYRKFQNLPDKKKRIRPPIENTVKEFRRNENWKGKIWLRGKFKASLYALTNAISINFRRIVKYIRSVVQNSSISTKLLRIYQSFNAVIIHFVMLFQNYLNIKKQDPQNFKYQNI